MTRAELKTAIEALGGDTRFLSADTGTCKSACWPQWGQNGVPTGITPFIGLNSQGDLAFYPHPPQPVVPIRAPTLKMVMEIQASILKALLKGAQ